MEDITGRLLGVCVCVFVVTLNKGVKVCMLHSPSPLSVGDAYV